MSKFKILIVDDVEEIFLTLQLILRNLELREVKTVFEYACSGKEAIELLSEKEKFDLVFLDIVMESENAGFQVLDHIRNTLFDERTKICILSGKTGSLPEEYVHLINGFDNYISKCDMDYSQLQNMVLEFMSV